MIHPLASSLVAMMMDEDDGWSIGHEQKDTSKKKKRGTDLWCKNNHHHNNNNNSDGFNWARRMDSWERKRRGINKKKKKKRESVGREMGFKPREDFFFLSLKVRSHPSIFSWYRFRLIHGLGQTGSYSVPIISFAFYSKATTMWCSLRAVYRQTCYIQKLASAPEKYVSGLGWESMIITDQVIYKRAKTKTKTKTKDLQV